MKFKDLGLSDSLLKAIEKSGFDEPTPIQAQTIPLLLKGQDVIGQAQTGTGKTAAFALPILQEIDLNNPDVQALVISPTRELAIQTQKEMQRLGGVEGARVQVVYGGSDIRQQIRDLKKTPQIVVGTPGRILDHINRRTLKLGHVKYLVLDEADEMLNMGFLDDIESIIKNIPSDRQTLLFSATMPAPIKRVGVQFMRDPKQITVKSKELTTDLVDQYYVKVKDNEKFDTMTRLFDVQTPKVTIVFCRTKRRVDEVSKGLIARGYRAAGLHGDLTQKRRTQIMNEFKNDKINYLVATDVAARGIDVSGVTYVYNFDIPQDPESYVHRIGRTGRAGHHGTSVTFVTPNEMSYLRGIEKLTKVRMLPLKPPSEDEALAGQLKFAENDIEKLVQKTDTAKFERVAKKLLEKYDSVDLVSALLNDMTRDQVKVHITAEKPLKNHGGFGGHRSGGYHGKRNDRNSHKRFGNRRGGHDSRRHDSRGRNGGNHGKSKGFVIKNK
ncbi:DEAD/DEAH box helicase [Fructilactobacillus fructivorans]|uniref:DEAD-box ATP-dependent RNA helicase CshA n=1 Tax=Fructilactobacillus fructivorans TaxID=1614 RepID=A0AAE6TXC0_9LACO|nr:DEAD/DEAH box helicase [Fructilactobacillus fructivorans]KRK57374.1 DEAD DEAH box helicase domain-containing protein [Fructilactobacillus fructivorans]KRN41025.1 DEAD DEAH box helicase domain-containing protein [Fructilactobacillus fructivorans]KRN42989.1 DEAD DEAH box helicase domain-containing protein [Fructilactobacillus fructivorans]QFX93058.1 DEAD/DEAH box helicase [Fructilactobacillus fructivorans]RDV64677.1 DEAD/DEAH box helicase [Fructilactobacillus fructivorans]